MHYVPLLAHQVRSNAQLYQRLVVELQFSASSLSQNGGLQTSAVNFHVAGVSAI